MPVGVGQSSGGASEIDLHPSASRAAQTYYSERKEKLGINPPPQSRAYARDRRWKDFLRIAELCVGEGWDPADYVSRGIELLGQNAVFMVPSDLLVDNVKASYRKRAALAGSVEPQTEPEEDLEFADDMLRGMAGDDKGAVDRVLMSPFTSFPAWYRCVRGSEDVARAWAPAAAAELRRSMSLDDFVAFRYPWSYRVIKNIREDSND